MSKLRVTKFEHQSLCVGELLDDNKTKFDDTHLATLSRFYDKGKNPYFTLVNKGIQFTQFVGVIQVGKLVIEVLPKADYQPENDTVKSEWRDRLIGMLRAVSSFDMQAPSLSRLAIQSNSILEMYFELFIREVEFLVHTGLIKQYRKVEGNNTALKGSLVFSKHIQKNIVHQERFYTRYITFDREHIWHIIIYKAIGIIRTLTTSARLHSRIGALELLFPEMPDKQITEQTFSKLKFTRKMEGYRNAIEIAKLLILHYHPDVKAGTHNVLALMFDMNKLWESFVYVSLKKGLLTTHPKLTVHKQSSAMFWEADEATCLRIRPDIVISYQDGSRWIWDTKWKTIKDGKPSSGDLMQMYAYNEFFTARRAALVYPGEEAHSMNGIYKHPARTPDNRTECGVIKISVIEKGSDKQRLIRNWQNEIYGEFVRWAGLNKD